MEARSLRFVFNTRAPEKFGSHRIHFQFLRRALEPMVKCAALGDWDHYDRYDVAVFQAGDGECRKAKARNPRLIVGLTKLAHEAALVEEMRRADFLLSDAAFQADAFRFVGKPILVARLVEEWPGEVEHVPFKGPFTTARPALVGYHGNLMHLEQIGGDIGAALEKVRVEVPLRLRAIYDIRALGRWKRGRPAIEIEDVQWTWESLHRQLAECDIGVVPGLVRPRAPRLWGWITRRERLLGGWHGAFPDDVVLRFKTSSNAGRAFVFMQLGVPVVADAVPECVEVLEPDRRGLTARTESGWYNALMDLLADHQERAAMGKRAREWASANLRPELEARKLFQFVVELFDEPQVS